MNKILTIVLAFVAMALFSPAYSLPIQTDSCSTHVGCSACEPNSKRTGLGGTISALHWTGRAPNQTPGNASFMQTIRTDENRKSFLEALATHGNITQACRDSRLSRCAVYDWRDDEPEFAAEWLEAQDRGTDAIEDEAHRRAVQGTQRPVFYEGQVCGHVQEFSDSLMTLLLKARRPEKFKDRSAAEISGPGGAPLVQVYLPENTRAQATPVDTEEPEA